MTVTAAYNWFLGAPEFVNNLFTEGDQNITGVTANFARTDYFVAWNDPNASDQVEGRILDSKDVPVTDELTLNSGNNTGLQFGGLVAGLANGNFALAYTDTSHDPSGDVYVRVFSANASSSSVNVALSAAPNVDERASSIASLPDGSWVVAWGITNIDGINTDIFADVIDSSGHIGSPISVDVSTDAMFSPTVAGLTNNNIVFAYEDRTTDQVVFRRFTESGTALDANPVPINLFATQASNAHVVALQDGGFAIAYQSIGEWSGAESATNPASDISLMIFNADGSLRTGRIQVNSDALQGLNQDTQDQPTITTLGNGMIVVGYDDLDTHITYAQVFDPAGNPLGNNQLVASGATTSLFAGLSGTLMAVARTSTAEDGAGHGTSIRTAVEEFGHIYTSDDASDTIIGATDGLREFFAGNGGDDTFVAGTGTNNFRGDAGSDTASYQQAVAGVTANLADSTQNGGPAAHDTYISIENLTGSAFNDNLTGDAGPNVLSGGDGADVIHGGAGDDHLNGGAGGDTLNGGPGDDTMDGGDGVDIAVFSGPRSAYTIRLLSDGVHVSGPDGNDLLTNIEHLVFDDTTVAAPLATHWSTSIDVPAHPAGWTASVTGDFNHDGTGDLAWYNATTGDLDIWKFTGGNWGGSNDVGTHPAGWVPAASGDFNGDGTSDIAWFNASNGNVDVWTIVNGQWTGSVNAGSHPAGSTLVGAGDFTGDGTSDIAWFDQASGHIDIWKIVGGQWAASIDAGGHAPGWTPAGIGDFDGDGSADLLWFNAATGNAEVWKIVNGATVATFNLGNHSTGATPHVADFTGDGTSDILWHNPATGDVDLWRIASDHVDADLTIGPHPTGWTIVATVDLNHDGAADVTWQDAASGRIDNWMLGN